YPDATLFGDNIVGRVEDVAALVVEQIRQAVAEARSKGGPAVRFGFGEWTVALPPNPGQGGRAQPLALLVARSISGARGVTVTVGGSDGIDGNTQAAGATVTGDTWTHALQLGDPAAALANFDSSTALGAVGALEVTGPTGNNLNDMIVI